MKYFFTAILILFASAGVEAQKVYNFEDAAKEGISKDSLDQVYRTAIAFDEQKAVFRNEKGPEFFSLYQKFHIGLAHYLYKNGVKWDKQIVVPFRMYAGTSVRIDYILINTAILDLSEDSKQKFIGLAQEYVSKNPTLLPAEEQYRQCISVPYAKPINKTQ